MPRFYFDKSEINGEYIRLCGENARHISLSLRMAVGDKLTLCDKEGSDYACTIEKIDRESVTAKINGTETSRSEPKFRATLFQCLAKGEKNDYIIQKSVELGVSRIVLVESERSIAKLTKDTTEKKLARWRKIAAESAGQCGRGIIPTVDVISDYSEAAHLAAKSDLFLFCYEGGGTKPIKTSLENLVSGKIEKPSISFFIGPEGGFSEKEVLLAKECGAVITGLGRRILRTETASLYVMSALSYEFD
jgi:16S rRNA (uracil1498-N3)-methyltransferase